MLLNLAGPKIEEGRGKKMGEGGGGSGLHISCTYYFKKPRECPRRPFRHQLLQLTPRNLNFARILKEKIENGKRDHAEEKQTSHQHVFTISQ
jgi:ribosomal protein L15